MLLKQSVSQVQINPKAGLTFASGLRSILRQDPDVIMIGEIRDVETARIAARAAITGHRVLTTIHTNDAASTFMRLVDMLSLLPRRYSLPKTTFFCLVTIVLDTLAYVWKILYSDGFGGINKIGRAHV